MMHWSIKHGYVQIIEKMLEPSINEQISTSVMKKAINEGETKVIKTLAINAIKQQGTPELAQENLHALTKLLPKKRGIPQILHASLYKTFTLSLTNINISMLF